MILLHDQHAHRKLAKQVVCKIQ